MPGSLQSPPLQTYRAVIALSLVSTVAACATRSVPGRFTPIGESPAPTVARVLSEAPPLPGEETSSWIGLESAPLPPSASTGGVPLLPASPGTDVSSEVDAILSRPLTPDSAVRLALLNNRELQSSLLEVGVARGQRQQAGLLPNPTFGVEVGAQGESRPWSMGGLSIEYDLTSALLVPLRKQVATAELEASRLRAAGSVIETGYSVRTAFFAAQAAQERLAIAHQSLDAFAASREVAHALVDAGNVPQIDADTQDAAYETARVTVAQLELEWLDRKEALQQLLGLAGAQTGWSIRETLPALPSTLTIPEEAESKALQSSLNLAETRSRLEALARHAGLTRVEGWLPDVTIEVRGDREENGWRSGAGLRITLPILDQKQGLATSQEAAFDSLVERYKGQAIEIRSKTRIARNRVQSTHAQASQLRNVILPARQRVLEQTLLQYNAMQVGVFQLLQARRELLNAELAAVDAQRDYWTAAAALDAILAGHAVGSTLTGSTNSLAAESSSGEGH